MRNLFFYSFALDALVTLDSSKTRQLMVKRFTCTNIALPKHQVITKIAYFLFSGNVQLTSISDTAQKLKFSIKDFSGKCDQIRRKLRIWSHLLEKSLMENLIFCAVRLLEFWSYFNWKSSLLLQYRRPKSSQFAVLH